MMLFYKFIILIVLEISLFLCIHNIHSLYATSTTTNSNSSVKLDNSIDRLHFSSTNETQIKNGTLNIGNENIPITYAKENGSNVFQGDIILNNLKVNGKAAVDKFIENQPWTDGIIPYKIDSNIPNQSSIIYAIEEWISKTPLQFIQITPQNQNNYINYIKFVPNPNVCSSAIGMQGGEQIITVANWCKTSDLIHEIGHAVGLWHEISRCDRDKYVAIETKNINASQLGQFQSLCNKDPHQESINSNSPLSIGAYDYCSITHYGEYAGSINQKPTIIPKQPVVGCKGIGENNHLSQGDVQGVQTMYKELDWK